MEMDAGVIQYEDGGGGYRKRNAGSPEKLEKVTGRILPWSLRKQRSPADTLILES